MTVKQWNVGDVLTAADMNAWTVPVYALKTSDQSVTSSTTLVNDTALSAPLAANATYYFTLDLLIVANATARFNSQFTTTATGATLNCGIMGFNASASFGATVRNAFSTPVVFDGNGVATAPLWFRGEVQTSSTAGTFQFQWAQSVSNATACTVKAGSQLLLVKTG